MTDVKDYTPSLENYLRGRPLSQELDEMMHEAKTAAADPRQPPPLRSFLSTTITQDDRYWLDKFRSDPGFRVLMRVLDKAILRLQEATILFSQTEPLKNKEEIAIQWMNVACLKFAVRQIEAEVDAELAKGTIDDE
jgi:hypothetical protein